MPGHDDDVALLSAIVREAGAIARKFVTGENPYHVKPDGSPVSEADLAVNTFLAEALRAARPGYGWLSEESEDDPARLTADRVFVVDPIDGTSALIARAPEFTVCVGVVEDHRAVCGAVYNPLTEEFFLAGAGRGAFLNDRPIRVSSRTELAGCRMLVRPGLTGRPMWQHAPWPVMHEEDRSSAAYRLVLVAAGLFDASVSLSAKRDWDIAAADIIVREAGGAVLTCDGSVPRYNRKSVLCSSAISAGPGLQAEILARTGKIVCPIEV